MAAARKSTLIPVEKELQLLANASGRHEGTLQTLTVRVQRLEELLQRLNTRLMIDAVPNHTHRITKVVNETSGPQFVAEDYWDGSDESSDDD